MKFLYNTRKIINKKSEYNIKQFTNPGDLTNYRQNILGVKSKYLEEIGQTKSNLCFRISYSNSLNSSSAMTTCRSTFYGRLTFSNDSWLTFFGSSEIFYFLSFSCWTPSSRGSYSRSYYWYSRRVIYLSLNGSYPHLVCYYCFTCQYRYPENTLTYL